MKAIHFSCTLPLFSSLILPVAPSPSSFLFLYMATSQKKLFFLPMTAISVCGSCPLLHFHHSPLSPPLRLCPAFRKWSLFNKKKKCKEIFNTKRKAVRRECGLKGHRWTDGRRVAQKREKKGWKWWGMVDDEWSRCLDSEHRQREGNWMEQKDWEADTEINRE